MLKLVCKAILVSSAIAAGIACSIAAAIAAPLNMVLKAWDQAKKELPHTYDKWCDCGVCQEGHSWWE